TEFLWNGDVLLQEATRDVASGQDLKSRTYYFEPATFTPVALSENSETYQYHLDHLGTPDVLTNANGDVVWSVSYKSYGNLALAHCEKISQPIRFQGQYFDQESGLHYNRFRFYDPHQGAFLNQDPIGLEGGINNYSYAPNPIGWIDPYGLTCKENQWNTFQKRSKGVFKDSTQASEGYKLWKNQEWDKLQGLLGPSAWPPNRGAVNVSKFSLKPGDGIDRYGGWVDDLGFHDKGTFVSPIGESFPSRALPDNTLNKPYNQYVVLKEFEVEASPAIPWFGKPGMGVQYELPANIDDLLEAGVIAPK
uniref:glycohydrolase toxin TNT-related protein n=1 Tax=Microbulbifer mangrovi TaxID=927787 RepID=UPI00117CE8B9